MRHIKEFVTSSGYSWTEAMERAFSIYISELKKWTKKINLTSIKDEGEIEIKHIVDSLHAIKYVPRGTFLMDIGAGAGFPSLPLKILEDSLRVVMLEASEKKVAFINHIIRLLSLKNARAIQQRAEDRNFLEIMRETVDVVIGRAVTSPDLFLKIAFPYAKKRGMIIYMLGKNQNPESFRETVNELGLKEKFLESYILPDNMGERKIWVLEKE